jgi:hypothetical protein
LLRDGRRLVRMFVNGRGWRGRGGRVLRASLEEAAEWHGRK